MGFFSTGGGGSGGWVVGLGKAGGVTTIVGVNVGVGVRVGVRVAVGLRVTAATEIAVCVGVGVGRRLTGIIRSTNSRKKLGPPFDVSDTGEGVGVGVSLPTGKSVQAPTKKSAKASKLKRIVRLIKREIFST